MFIGHYAPALLAAAVLPQAPRLGTLFLAAQAVDIAFFVFTLLGIEHYAIVPGFTVMNAFDLYDMRWTHSLFGTLGWAALFALGLRLAGSSWATARIAAAVVASHWFLDLLVHAPDLTIAGAAPKHGLGLWNLPEVAIPLELALVAGALTAYAGRARAGMPLVVLAAALLLVQAINWFAPQPTEPIYPAPAILSITALLAFAGLALIARWAGETRTRA